MTALLEAALNWLVGVGAAFLGVGLFGVGSVLFKKPVCLIAFACVNVVFVFCQVIDDVVSVDFRRRRVPAILFYKVPVKR